jgi:hypothetical protein
MFLWIVLEILLQMVDGIAWINHLSFIDMDEISLYELINENQMLSNLALAMQSNGRTVPCQLKRSQSTSSTTSSEKSYSEIADDNAYLNPYLIPSVASS